MGTFDTVIVPCPRCGEPHPLRSTTGDRLTWEYPLERAMPTVLLGLPGCVCTKCRTGFAVEILGTKPVLCSHCDRATLPPNWVGRGSRVREIKRARLERDIYAPGPGRELLGPQLVLEAELAKVLDRLDQEPPPEWSLVEAGTGLRIEYPALQQPVPLTAEDLDAMELRATIYRISHGLRQREKDTGGRSLLAIVQKGPPYPALVERLGPRLGDTAESLWERARSVQFALLGTTLESPEFYEGAEERGLEGERWGERSYWPWDLQGLLSLDLPDPRGLPHKTRKGWELLEQIKLEGPFLVLDGVPIGRLPA